MSGAAAPAAWAQQGVVVYVDDDAVPGGDGAAWESAYSTLADAIDRAGLHPEVTEIRIAAGVYRPGARAGHTSMNRTETFNLRGGLVLKGGYEGISGDANGNARNPEINQTLLSGDLAANDTQGTFSDNAFHVLVAIGAADRRVVDGVTIADGRADGPWPSPRATGGGALCTDAAVDFRDCRFEKNSAAFYGGAVRVAGGDVRLVRCQFLANEAGEGGAVSVSAGNITADSSVFLGNVARQGFVYGSNGGAMSVTLDGASARLRGCVFSGNNCAEFGGAVFVFFAPLVIEGCTFAGNRSVGEEYAEGGGIYVSAASDVAVYNTILWGNTDAGGSGAQRAQVSDPFHRVNVASSCVQGLEVIEPGLWNIGMDPGFVDAAGADDVAGTPDDDLRLAAGSPCIDAGLSSLVSSDEMDLDEDGDTEELRPSDAGGAARIDCTPRPGPLQLHEAFTASASFPPDPTVTVDLPDGVEHQHEMLKAYELGEFPRAGPHMLLRDPALMDRHLAAIAPTLRGRISEIYSGRVLIDYEYWRIEWDLVRNEPQEPGAAYDAEDEDFKNDWEETLLWQNPNVFDGLSAIEKEAHLRETYEATTLDFMIRTLARCREVCPNARFSFFWPPRSHLFSEFTPEGVIGYGDGTHEASRINDRFQALYDDMDFVGAGLYCQRVSVDVAPNDEDKEYRAVDALRYVYSNAAEFRRLAGEAKPVVPLLWLRYVGILRGPWFDPNASAVAQGRGGGVLLRDLDFRLWLEQAARSGCDSAALWYNIVSQEDNDALEGYMLGRAGRVVSEHRGGIVDIGAFEMQRACDPPPVCRADWNGDGLVDSQDYFEFVEVFVAGEADFNGDSAGDSQDFFDFLDAFFAGCVPP